ncbi:MAG: hypothetical protein FJX62_23260 [Alphaproteobacteria bacterium]|nr:hypothetical protein [Alphaproteobacteria bacterium]
MRTCSGATCPWWQAGPARLLWARDWPWTQNRARLTCGRTLNWLAQWILEAQARAAILGATPARLLGFEKETQTCAAPRN